jgi:mRNA-degrading endonuclease RelE of RelBE toxin-antitoxin system
MVRRERRRTLGKALGVRGARSAYILFVNENRDRKKAENSEASNTDLVKLLAADWRALDASERQRFETLAREDKERYDRELAAAKESNPDGVQQFRMRKHKKRRRNNFGVKGPRSAYILFSSDIRPKLQTKHPNLKMTELTKKIGEEWKKLSTSRRSRFQKEADKDRRRFQRELEAARAQNENVTEDTTATTEAPAQETPAAAAPAKKTKKVVKRKRSSRK